MRETKLVFFFLLGILASACLPRLSRDSHLNSQANATGEEDKGPGTEESLYWNYGGQKITGTITLNQDFNTVLYIYGKTVHRFLDNDDNHKKLFCLVATLGRHDSAKKQWRMRAYPDNYIQWPSGIKERFLRLDIPLTMENRATCSGTVDGVSDGEVAFSLKDICPGCHGIIASRKLSLYEVSEGAGIASGENLLNLSFLGGMRVDPQNDSPDLSSSVECRSGSNAACRASDFNCCLEGQCVRDGQERPRASGRPDYHQALADVAKNPTHFSRYPQIYFVCGDKVATDLGNPDDLDSSASKDVEAEGEKYFQALVRDYLCLEEGKKEASEAPDFSVCGSTEDQAAYEAVRESVWKSCGCKADPFPTDPSDLRCPDYGLKAIKNRADEIIDIETCVVPKREDLQNSPPSLVEVSARSVPHRFFKKSDGVGVDLEDDIASLGLGPGTGSTESQEGEGFLYLDERNKTDPEGEDFNMNALLGPMAITLDKALPAKIRPVAFDQDYIISAIDGYYTPCSECPYDSWFGAFRAYPSIQGGNGLQSWGYTTSRDNYVDNISKGNYEDTIWGRACWIPPTMIPFSHRAQATVSTQRTNRLKTQSALYANGLQRDWYGFNKGAVIGSFDGVRWFAVGEGRRVRSSSEKLYLAINAPFGDLAQRTSITVSVVADRGGNMAADYDFDPTYGLDDSKQNQGGTCRANHMCEKDLDCVTKLGWEYSCVDVFSWKSLWPQFDIKAEERGNRAMTVSFHSLLHGGMPPGSTQRCVYRGMGAICKGDYTTFPAGSEKREMFRCAPNFYCHPLGEAGFNSKVVRTPGGREDALLFGQETDILGRPLYYLQKDLPSESLPLDVQNTIEANISAFLGTSSTTTPPSSDWGLCRPGKILSAITTLGQHQGRDSEGRTDFISQISSCDSKASGAGRVISCPAFELDDEEDENFGNYLIADTTAAALSTLGARRRQNSCGGESLNGVDGISAFEAIESPPLTPQSSLLEPTLVADACFRRPGSPCHSNLDCAPNPLHEVQVDVLGDEYFGRSRAERNYWTESMVCGQRDGYDFTQNRCCREVGKTLTMYVETQGTSGHIPDFDVDNLSLKVAQFPIDGPGADNRYSRYSVIDLSDPASPPSRSTTFPYAQAPIVVEGQTPKMFQWKAINDTGAKSCCGGGWVRQFADGDPDWSKPRLNLSVSNFRCLNYQTTLPFLSNSLDFGIDRDNFDLDSHLFCWSPDRGGCIQVPIAQSSDFGIVNPREVYTGVARLDTTPDGTPPDDGGVVVQDNRHYRAPYMPVAYDFPYRNFFYFPQAEVSFYLPLYISKDNIRDVSLHYYEEDDDSDDDSEPQDLGTESLSFVPSCPSPPSSMPEHRYCLGKDSTNTYDVFYGTPGVDESLAADWAGVKIAYDFPNTPSFRYSHSGGGTPSTDPKRSGLVAGNDSYYLTKLGRLELIGIPQIFYEPIYCNSNRNRLLPGIFREEEREDFVLDAFDYNSSVNGVELQKIYNSGARSEDSSLREAPSSAKLEKIVFQDQLDLPQIFSGDTFRCCKKLGQRTSASNLCCSHHTVDIGSTGRNLICMLPPRTNLNVYFNRFVSSEGVGKDEFDVGFEDTDFIPETGEVKFNPTAYGKLIALGEKYCDSGRVSEGGAFGHFYAEPHNGTYATSTDLSSARYFSIVDSWRDYYAPDTSSGGGGGDRRHRGHGPFFTGYHWNHHYYCF